MNKKEKLLLIEIHKELKCFMWLSKKISNLSKDMSDRGNKWMVEDKIVIEDGGLKFTSKDDTIWIGCHRCPHCRTFFECDIIIKNGTIKEIKNLREYKYE